MKQGIGLSGSTPAWVAVIPTCGIVGTRDQDVCGPRVSNDSAASQPTGPIPAKSHFGACAWPVPRFRRLYHFAARSRTPLICIRVMRGLVTRIHVFGSIVKTWMAGTSPAMTWKQQLIITKA